MTDVLDASLTTTDTTGAVPTGRDRRLLDGLRRIADRPSGRRIDGERLLFLLGAVFAPLGFLLVLVGWYGSAGSGLVFEQVPYVVSGGLGGLALVIVGCTLYACWWITRAIRDQRERHVELAEQQREMVTAMRELSAEVASLREAQANR